MRLGAAVQGGVRGARKGLGKQRVAHEPDGHEVAGIEAVVQERREVAEELGGHILGPVHDPEAQFTVPFLFVAKGSPYGHNVKRERQARGILRGYRRNNVRLRFIALPPAQGQISQDVRTIGPHAET